MYCIGQEFGSIMVLVWSFVFLVRSVIVYMILVRADVECDRVYGTHQEYDYTFMFKSFKC